MSEAISGVTVDLAQLIGTRRSVGAIRRRNDLSRAVLLGETRSRQRGSGIVFEEVRPYQPGDDVRAIDWRVSARTGVTHAKVFASDREQPTYVLLDQRPTMFFGSGATFKSVFAARMASTLAWQTLNSGERFGAQIIGANGRVCLPARRGRPALLRFFSQVCDANQALSDRSTVRPNGIDSLACLLRDCQRTTRRGCNVYVLSDFIDFDRDAAQILMQLALGRHLNLIRIRDPLEADFDVSGKLGISGSHGQQQLAIRVSKRFRERLKHQQQAHTSLLTRTCRQSGARLLEALTNDPLGTTLSHCAASVAE